MDTASDEGHVYYPGFGLQRIRDEEPTVVEELFKATDQSFDSMTAKVLLLDRYEQTYNICDHERVGDVRPLSVVAMHPKEDPVSYSKAYRTFYRFSEHQIYERFGIPIDRFLELPHEYVELLFKISTDNAKEEDPAIERQLRQLKKEARNAGLG